MDIRLPRFRDLPGPQHVDVVVVGGGITGATVALVLKRRGHRVAIVEADHVGSGETARTTAHLTAVLDCRLATLVSRLGRNDATLVALAHVGAIDWMERTVRQLGIDCGFQRVPGHLFAEAGDEQGAATVAKEAEAAAALGIPAHLGEDMPLPIKTQKVLEFPNQAQMHPLAYLRGLYAALLREGGCDIYEGTRVTAVEDGEPCRVETDRGILTCNTVVVAAHVPVVNRVLLHAKLEPMRTYVIARSTDLPEDLGLFWDTANPYHYWRTARVGDETLLLVGGGDQPVGESGVAGGEFSLLEQHAEQRLGSAAVRYRWSGQIIEPVDGLPFVGRNSLATRVFVATGYSGNGMTGATLAALIFAGEIEGVKHPAAELLAATRVTPVASLRGFVRQNGRVARHMLFDRRHLASIDEVACLAPCTGRVVTVEGKPLAIHRQADGTLEAVSAICTHLGGLVAWNATERSWDCPCHGSRFAPDGQVVNGPAVEALPPHHFDEADQGEEVRVDSESEGIPAREVVVGSTFLD